MPRRRLFWKILIAFLLTFVAITQLTWLLFTVTQGTTELPAFLQREQIGPVAMAGATMALENGGQSQYQRFLASLPEAKRTHFALLPAHRASANGWQKPPVKSGEAALDKAVRTPDGTVHILRYHFVDERPFRILNVPPTVLWLGLGAGFVFASLLAWYLTSPIAHLRRGFDQLARGNLSIRLAPLIGRRRDEVADLAGDFDRMARQVELLVDARDRLLHDVSHELRSPLARIQLATALAERSPQRTAQALERVGLEVDRLDALVGELLTLARAENQGSPGEDYFDLAGVTESVVADVQFEAGPAGVTIDLAVPQGLAQPLPLVRGNSELLRRAIENILRNALRFSPPQGRIAVRVERLERAAGLRLTIEDEGPGIPDDQVDAMFLPFVRASNEGANFGLGLAIASRAVRLHRGTLEARNRSRSRGDGAKTGGLRVIMEIPTLPITAGRRD